MDGPKRPSADVLALRRDLRDQRREFEDERRVLQAMLSLAIFRIVGLYQERGIALDPAAFLKALRGGVVDPEAAFACEQCWALMNR